MLNHTIFNTLCVSPNQNIHQMCFTLSFCPSPCDFLTVIFGDIESHLVRPMVYINVINVRTLFYLDISIVGHFNVLQVLTGVVEQ